MFNGECFLQEFDDARDAEDAVYDLNGKELCGDRYDHAYTFCISCLEVLLIWKMIILDRTLPVFS